MLSSHLKVQSFKALVSQARPGWHKSSPVWFICASYQNSFTVTVLAAR